MQNPYPTKKLIRAILDKSVWLLIINAYEKLLNAC